MSRTSDECLLEMMYALQQESLYVRRVTAPKGSKQTYYYQVVDSNRPVEYSIHAAEFLSPFCNGLEATEEELHEDEAVIRTYSNFNYMQYDVGCAVRGLGHK